MASTMFSAPALVGSKVISSQKRHRAPVRSVVTKAGKQANILRRVEEKKLLSAVEAAGLLSKAEKAGLTLSKIESLGLLSTAEGLGALSFATDKGSPGVLTFVGLIALSAAGAVVYAVPDDTSALLLAQAVGAAVLGAGGLAALGGSAFLSDLQKE
ncbi:hypothetical protein CYMTET_42939 [Cymbomonas tetramitiformis]|uniref:Uncharacterized protein n=1 Tax=Cymbomonas tetramitiformis TaxID=36881 RepID=A0AAE0F153_9CHLO|nr:hypothetical protein CYMTET_42939 [Cymbomonas tetramitiformis]